MLMFNRFGRVCALLVCCGAPLMVDASEVPIATLGASAIYASDLEADLLRVPESGRQTAASDVSVVQQAAANLALRKAIALKARQEKLDQLPAIQAQMDLAQQRLLSDIWLAEVEKKAAKTRPELERIAELKYQAEAFSRFKIPAQIKIRHILVPKTPDGKAKAEGLLLELKAGADFADLAKQHSADPGSAARGGDLGLVGPGKMVPEFEKAAFALTKVGELSAPIESTFGYHIIRLDQREESKIAPFSEVKDGLIQEVTTKLQTEARNAAVADMFKQITVNQEAVQRFVDAAKGKGKVN